MLTTNKEFFAGLAGLAAQDIDGAAPPTSASATAEDGGGGGGGGGGRMAVAACGVDDPRNVGSMFRLMSCFGLDDFLHIQVTRHAPKTQGRPAVTAREVGGCGNSKDHDNDHGTQPQRADHTAPTPPDVADRLGAMESKLHALHAEIASLSHRVATVRKRASCAGTNGEPASPSEFWTQPPIVKLIRTTGRGTEKRFLPFESVHVSTFMADRMGAPAGGRVPIVCIETATGAQSIFDYRFPERCLIMVGGEDRGIPVRLLKKLDSEHDAIVYVPMNGPHHSLNVVAALTCAVFEYRRQWPTTLTRS